MAEICERSRLRVCPERLWAEVSTMAGVNAELRPWLRMTTPAAARAASIADAPLGEVAFVSWLLALGVLPFDRHALCLIRVEPERGFLERSSSWLQRVWEHERTLTAIAGGTELVDRVRFEPRVGFTEALARPIVAALFRHRHAQLRARHGALDRRA